jgi:polysaccharide biosynthesis protein PslH
VIANVLEHVSRRHEVALVYLRESGEAPLDEGLHTRLDLVEEVARLRGGTSPRSLLAARARDVVGLARGRPRWVRELDAPDLPHRLAAVVALWRPDLVQVEYLVMMKNRRMLGHSAPVVLVEHDPAVPAAHGRYLADRGMGKVTACAELLAWRAFARRALRALDSVVVFTDRDAIALRQLVTGVPVVTIPLGVDVSQEALDPAGDHPPSLLFVGSFIHEPNVDAATRLARCIFPRVTSMHPGVELLLVGHRPTPEVLALAGDRVTVHGDVPDVTPFLDRAAAVVVPVRMGGGMRVKVLEAFAAGKALVASRRAVEGLDVIPGQHLLLAETDDEFVEAVSQLLVDERRRIQLAVAGREWVRGRLSWDHTARRFEDLYSSLLSVRASGVKP